MTRNRFVVVLLAAVLGIAALGYFWNSSRSNSAENSSTATVKGSPNLPDFYAVPASLRETSPGTILKSEPVQLAGLNGSMSRVMYSSTSEAGQTIAVTGLLAIPNGTPPNGGWPVITWAHGTTGLADSCAPSLTPDDFIEFVNPLLDAGYLVVATDYEGLGTPGRHPYISGNSEAYGTLDIVKAAQVFPGANASKNYVVWGHSQGGHAALFAGHAAEAYAPDLNLKGVVAGAPPSQLLLINEALQTSPYKHYILMAAAGLNAAAGDATAPLEKVLTPAGLKFLSNVDTMCATELGKESSGLDIKTLQLADPASIPEWNNLLTNNDPGTFTEPIPSPLLIIHGGNDEQIPVVSSAALFDQLCKVGQVAQRWVFAGQSHAGVIAPSFSSMVKWIGDRFAGKPMPDPIVPDGAVVQSCPRN